MQTMAKTYQVNSGIRFFNRLFGAFIRLGIAPKSNYLLSVRGRNTGKRYATPVSLVEQDRQRWLVSPYGEMNWVKNARAAGEVTLSRGGQTEIVRIQEATPEASAPVLKAYLQRETITRPYFDVQPDSPLEAFVAEAPRHPVFRMV
jgi:deazaflavin-dependent oxidoreductase (nitroreductase family)